MKTVLHVAFVLTLIMVVGCHQEHAEHEDETTFLVTSPYRTDTSVVSEYVCQIHAIQHIELRALERGYLEKILVDEGQRVGKGTLMFQILPIVYQAEYQTAAAEARVAEIEYQNTKRLADSNVVSQNELAMARARYDKALANVSLAKAHLEFTRISAPFTGIMDRLHVRVGSLLEEGEMLASLSDNSEMWVYFNVPEAQYLNYRMRNPKDNLIKVKLRMANYQVFDQAGVVTTIEADFNNETGNISFRATFPNPNGLLRHGETGTILMTEPLNDALLIPQKATFEILDKKYVFVINKDHKVVQRRIVVGAELPHAYVVTGGLKESDKILLEGLQKVRQGEKIHFTYMQPDSVIRALELHAE